ncbi:glutaredoxin family protein [Winogradskyella psychrotolerans]|uniref:glutaredoxin family protein n=1 Tax=Winogradskyella psychrotolerans TaxID=1344585 RepID=UPI000594A014|nr:glutaredoxin domain-containing protein [Winogradskyella psychrotolerans]
MSSNLKIKLYGTSRCHKTQHYIKVLNESGLQYSFLDVDINEDYAEELRNLYTTKKLNFPTITLGTKKLRNPPDAELNKWIDQLK